MHIELLGEHTACVLQLKRTVAMYLSSEDTLWPTKTK